MKKLIITEAQLERLKSKLITESAINMNDHLYKEILSQMVGYWASDYTNLDNIAKEKGLDPEALRSAFFKKLNAREKDNWSDETGYEDQGLWGFDPHSALSNEGVTEDSPYDLPDNWTDDDEKWAKTNNPDANKLFHKTGPNAGKDAHPDATWNKPKIKEFYEDEEEF